MAGSHAGALGPGSGGARLRAADGQRAVPRAEPAGDATDDYERAGGGGVQSTSEPQGRLLLHPRAGWAMPSGAKISSGAVFCDPQKTQKVKVFFQLFRNCFIFCVLTTHLPQSG